MSILLFSNVSGLGNKVADDLSNVYAEFTTISRAKSTTVVVNGTRSAVLQTLHGAGREWHVRVGKFSYETIEAYFADNKDTWNRTGSDGGVQAWFSTRQGCFVEVVEGLKP